MQNSQDILRDSPWIDLPCWPHLLYLLPLGQIDEFLNKSLVSPFVIQYSFDNGTSLMILIYRCSHWVYIPTSQFHLTNLGCTTFKSPKIPFFDHVTSMVRKLQRSSNSLSNFPLEFRISSMSSLVMSSTKIAIIYFSSDCLMERVWSPWLWW